VLDSTTPGADLTQSLLDSKKTTIEATRSSVSGQYSIIIAQKQAVANAKNSVSSYIIVYNKAVQDLEQSKANAENGVKIKEAALAQAVANYESKVNPPRAVDVASYRAALSQAVASRDKGMIRAPIDGVVTKVNKKVGELISGGDVMVNVLSPHFEVKVDISEVDVRKVKLQDAATITLDAFGTDNKLMGRVLAIDPGPTVIQDVVYYQVRIALDDATTTVPVKPGMTANITITTEEKQNVLYVPARAIKFNEEGERYAKVLENGVEKEYSVSIGLRANEGKQEVVEGLTEGQEVILSKKENK
jgi:HlyD family secretion protein